MVYRTWSLMLCVASRNSSFDSEEFKKDIRGLRWNNWLHFYFTNTQSFDNKKFYRGRQKGWQYGLTGGAKQWLPFWNIDTFFTQFLCGFLAALINITLRARGIMHSSRFDCSAVIFTIIAILLLSIRLEPGAPDSFTKQPFMAPFLHFLWREWLSQYHSAHKFIGF